MSNEEYRDRLVDFANRLGYDVELESMMEGHEEYDEEDNLILNKKGWPKSPAGDCNYVTRQIRVRGGKSLDAQITTLIHELAHALGLGGYSYFTWLGSTYIELACESIAEIVTQAIGLDRTKVTARHVLGYGFKGYLISPVTIAISKILVRELKGDEDAIG